MSEEILSVLDEVLKEFERRLAGVGPAQWVLPTPCAGWDVTALVRHVIDGNVRALEMMNGLPRGGREFGDNLLEAFCTTAAAAAEVFHEPGALERTFFHQPGESGGGELLIGEFIEMKIGGWAVHSWDLARAIGADEQLPDTVVQVAYDFYAPKAGTLPTRIYVQPIEAVGPDLSMQDRLLLSVGRQP